MRGVYQPATPPCFRQKLKVECPEKSEELKRLKTLVPKAEPWAPGLKYIARKSYCANRCPRKQSHDYWPLCRPYRSFPFRYKNMVIAAR